MLTVGSLVSDCGLELIAGGDDAERPIRWVHISELEDPTPWLSGGELLLTTGIQLSGQARQARVVSPLPEHRPPGPWLRHGAAAPAAAESHRARLRGALAPPVRGALRDAVHRDHRASVLAPGQ